MRPPRKLWRFYPKAKQQQWVLQDIRSHMSWFGYPIDSLTDEEIVDSVIKFAAIAAGFGVSMKQAVEATRAMQGAPNSKEAMGRIHPGTTDDGRYRK